MRPSTPNAKGVYVGRASVGRAAIEICSLANLNTAPTQPHVEFVGRRLSSIGTNKTRRYVSVNST